MKEVFTKSFWKGVKKTFDLALEDSPPPANKALQTPAEAELSSSSTSETPSSCATPSSASVPNGNQLGT